MIGRLKDAVPVTVAIVVLLVGWQAATVLLRVPAYILPPPLDIASGAIEGVTLLGSGLATTMSETLLGFAAGAVIGIALAVLFVLVPPLGAVLMPVAVAINAVPAVAFVPLALIWFGVGMASKIAMAALAMSFAVLINMLAGLQRPEQAAVDLLRSFGAGRLGVLWRLRLPAAMPALVTGLRVGLARSTIAVIVTEMLGAYAGIGQIIYQATAQVDSVTVWAAVLVASLSSLALYGLLVVIDRKLVWWDLTMPRASNDPVVGAAPDLDAALRVELAACYRLVAHFGMDDLIYNHISVRVPGPDHHFLINPYGLLFSEVTASCFVKIDLDGRKVEPSPHEVNRAGFVIHSAIHGGRADALCVLHTHSEAATAVSALRDGLLPLSQFAMRYQGHMGFHDYEGVAIETDERARLVADIGAHKVLLLRNHGVLTVGRTVPEAFILMYYFEKAARVQLLAQAAGARLTLPADAVTAAAARQFNDHHGDILPAGTREWPAFLRLLDKLDPSYKD